MDPREKLKRLHEKGGAWLLIAAFLTGDAYGYLCALFAPVSRPEKIVVAVGATLLAAYAWYCHWRADRDADRLVDGFRR